MDKSFQIKPPVVFTGDSDYENSSRKSSFKERKKVESPEIQKVQLTESIRSHLKDGDHCVKIGEMIRDEPR